MKPIGLAGLLVLLGTGSGNAQEKRMREYPPVTIPNTEIRTLHSQHTGHDYDIYVYRPARIAPDGPRVPVLYLLDAQWDFKLLTSIQGGLVFDRYVPDAIIVGITYTGANARYDSLRAIDYTPARGPQPGSGGAPKFLEFLKQELIPFIESEYPADPKRRALMGNSFGGLFTLYAMLQQPDLFSGYVAGSPAVNHGQRALFAQEAEFARSHTSLPARLFVMVGSDEPLAAPVDEFVRTLRSRNYPDLTLESRIILQERHSGNKPEGLNRGLRFVFRDSTPEAQPNAARTVGSIERLDGALDGLIARDARIEMLAEGFDWAEGPVWRSNGDYLLFSDVPKNTIYKWKQDEGLSVFLRPSGYIGENPPGSELGSNGLALDARGALVMADHGNRQVARVDEKNFSKVTLADRFEGKRFNSPNDLVFHSNGDLYFTDPPFGLAKLNDDPAKELPFSGVYRVSARGKVTLLTKELGFPNGIAFSQDERTLYVSNAEHKRPVWLAYPVKADGTLGAGRVFFDASKFVAAGKPGVPDGLRVDRNGNVFATGPGGVYVLDAQGKHLGTIWTGQATANCAFGDDGKSLYITAGNQLLRLRLK